MATPRKTVAVVDDDPSMLRATENLLDAHGFATVGFLSAEQFLARTPTLKIDFLLLDIDLGGISGIELHERLKTSGSSIPVIFMTAIDDVETLDRARRSGCVDCLRKPFPSYQLIAAIAKSA